MVTLKNAMVYWNNLFYLLTYYLADTLLWNIYTLTQKFLPLRTWVEWKEMCELFFLGLPLFWATIKNKFILEVFGCLHSTMEE